MRDKRDYFNKNREEKNFGRNSRNERKLKNDNKVNRNEFRKNNKEIEKKKYPSEELENSKEYEDIVEGRNAVLELLNSERDINKIFIQKGERHGSINKIIAIAKENRIVTVEVEKTKLDMMSSTNNHQGVIAVVPPFNYVEVEDILDYAKQKKESPFILILDGIEDPHNLGSIIRTAETAGVHGIIIPKRRAASVNSTVNKASAGAVEHMKIARVTNISDAIEELKQAGLWICGTDVSAEKYYYNQDLTGPLGIVIGNEGKGISDKVKKNCDFNVKIPMSGKIQSLNASVSTGIIVYEAVKQKNLKLLK